MPQVAVPIRKERAARLRARGEQQMVKFLAQHVGKERQVIVEKGNIGRTEHFAQVRLDRDMEPGLLTSVKTLGVDGEYLTGQVF
jgi:threonylcarbamoyladenosine tRNA methylthiotransferase MtaB